MVYFNYKNKISFILHKEYIKYILQILKPLKFSSIYRDVYHLILEQKKEESKTLQEKKEKFLNETLDELKTIDTITDVLIKRQTALSLLYSIFYSKATCDNTTSKINLNMMLAYELYLVIADEQLRISREIKEIDAGTHPKYLNIVDVNERSNIKNKYLKDFYLNKNLISIIFKDFSYSEIHKIRLDYANMDIIQHLEYCNSGA